MKRMDNIIFIGEINRRKIDLNFRDFIDVFSVNIFFNDSKIPRETKTW